MGLPLAFKYSTELQRNLIFPTCKYFLLSYYVQNYNLKYQLGDLWPPDPEFSNFNKYDVEGARNLYVTVNEDENITLGVWHILPCALVNDSIYDNYNYSDALANSEYPVVLHFHGNGGNRIADLEMYNILRMFFHIIAFDYRGELFINN